jgi:hypothetical protein
MANQNQNPDEPTHIQKLLMPIRESIVDKPPYTSGTLQLPNSYFSLFYKAKKDGSDARFEDQEMLGGPEQCG